MSTLVVRLFGNISISAGDQFFGNLEKGKVCELLSYIFIFHNCALSREVLASLFWGDKATTESKKYLRHTLWQLQTTLGNHSPLLIDPEWICINPNTDIWVDIIEFDTIYKSVVDVPGEQFDRQTFEKVYNAVKIYRGDLLQGWYQEWCIFERERLQNEYLLMLDKLIVYCEVAGKYETGLSFGERLLRIDPLRERTHQHLMRLFYLVGNRSAAIRQFHRCESVLNEELNVIPSKRTTALYDLICKDQLELIYPLYSHKTPMHHRTNEAIKYALVRLYEFQRLFKVIQDELRDDIHQLEDNLNNR